MNGILVGEGQSARTGGSKRRMGRALAVRGHKPRRARRGRHEVSLPGTVARPLPVAEATGRKTHMSRQPTAGPAGVLRRPPHPRPAADAMGRASRPRECQQRPSRDAAHAPSACSRRPAEPVSCPFFSSLHFRSAHRRPEDARCLAGMRSRVPVERAEGRSFRYSGVAGPGPAHRQAPVPRHVPDHPSDPQGHGLSSVRRRVAGECGQGAGAPVDRPPAPDVGQTPVQRLGLPRRPVSAGRPGVRKRRQHRE